MDKERLEEINRIARHKVLGNIEGEIRYRLTEINTEDYEWLIEQAERAQELQLEVNDWRDEVRKWQKFYEESEESHLETKELLYSAISENKRLSERSIKYHELLSDIANLAYYKKQDTDYYESLLKQIILFARYTLEVERE